MRVSGIDHVVLTVSDLDATCEFYAQLGVSVVRDNGRVALQAGDQRIVLQEAGRQHRLQAARPTPGSTSLCFVVNAPGRQIKRRLASRGVPTVTGPVERPGANGPVQSVYVRDPDGNLVELASYVRPAPPHAAPHEPQRGTRGVPQQGVRPEPPRDAAPHPPRDANPPPPPQDAAPPRDVAPPPPQDANSPPPRDTHPVPPQDVQSHPPHDDRPSSSEEERRRYEKARGLSRPTR